MGRVIEGRPLVAGEAAGEVLATDEPLSFWGGYDPGTGEFIDRRHPLSGQMGAGKVLVIPSTRGSSTTSAVLLEAIRAETAPAAILTAGADTFLALASIVADEMYRRPLPIIALSESDFATIRTGDSVRVEADGRILVEPRR
ncbi:MAG: DUF126 domain-containing protein [Gemmatimonadales bacterium]|nr:DUF126 domain-containing protein [Gemmatimonadales bacterium]NIN10149.1 DUF126 domain-containing protein [Gemmatimonadales bacterium]NIN48816.1 DUF126 domain-containing protein [Gemmatimonadales bacterium]NIP06280.1 DUF126 domain-containing protein [Gemmatimonadales bacterium]NIQ99256.1 DUF126 domain-containing protein [Gemmatimonadales bacterium]